MASKKGKKDLKKHEKGKSVKEEVRYESAFSYIWKHFKGAMGRAWSNWKIMPRAIPYGLWVVGYWIVFGLPPGEKINKSPLTCKLFFRRFFIVIDNIIASVLYVYFKFRVICFVENIDSSFGFFWNDYCLGPGHFGLIDFGFSFIFFFRKLYFSDRPCWENFRNKKFLKYWLYGNLAFPFLYGVAYLIRGKLFYFLFCLYYGVPQEVIGPRRYFALMLCTMLFFNVAAFRNLLHDFKKLGLMNDKSGRK